MQRKAREGHSTASSQLKAQKNRPDSIQKAHAGRSDSTVDRPDEIILCCSQANAEGEQQAFGFTLRPQPGQLVTATPPRPNLTGPDELLQISTGATGSPTVSARELHGFLQVKSRFNDWFSDRLKKYRCFVEGRDFVLVSQKWETNTRESSSKNFEKAGERGFTEFSVKGGRPETDYALTLGMAKELAMVQNNSQGKAARDYFLACEEQLRAIAEQPVSTATPSTTDPALLQLLTHQQHQIDQLQETVTALLHQRTSVPSPLTYPEASRLRQLTVRQIVAYCQRTRLAIRDGYTHFYQRLLAVHGVDVFALDKPLSGSYLDAIDRAGHLESLYAIVLDEVTHIDPY